MEEVQYLISMNKIIHIYYLLFVLLLYNNLSNSILTAKISKLLIYQVDEFLPDISINKKIFLCDAKSIKDNFGDLNLSMNHNSDFPYIFILNKTKEQYLKLIFSPGDIKNSFSQFEVGYTTNSVLNDTFNLISLIDTFFTESGISLGLCEEDILKIKGLNYTKNQIKDTLVLKYLINNYETSDFLKKYNTPLYFAEYFMYENRLIKFKFGFEYP